MPALIPRWIVLVLLSAAPSAVAAAPPEPAESAASAARAEAPPAAVAFAREVRNPAEQLLAELARRGYARAAAAKVLDSGEGMIFHERQKFLRQIGDAPQLAKAWAEEGARFPTNLSAVIGEANALRQLGQHRQALGVVERGLALAVAALDPASKHLRSKELLPLHCELLWELNRLDEAMKICSEAAAASPMSSGFAVLGKLHLEKGDDAIAARYLQQAMRKCSWCADNLFFYATALQRLGSTDDAEYLLQRALEVWPDYTPAYEVQQKSALPLDRRFAADAVWRRQQSARKLALCGRIYTGVGLARRAEDCFAAAERVEKGASAAERVASAYERNPRSARSLAAALVKTARHPELLALMAELQLEELGARPPAKKKAAVFALLMEAEKKAPVSYDVARTWLRACSTLDHAACAVERRGRLRFGSSREEQHLTHALQVDSRYLGYTPPQFTSFELLPMGMTRLDELEGLTETLSRRFPAITFRLLDPQPLPEGVTNGRGQVVFEYILPRLPGRKGTIGLVEQDFTGEGSNFLFATWSAETAQGVASVNRFRGSGGRTDPAVPLTPQQLAKSRERFANQLTSTIAKLMGMSFPCRAHKCVLKFPRSVEELDAKGGEFCEHHQSELARFMGR